MPDWAKAAALTLPRVNASDSGAPVSAQTVCCAPKRQSDGGLQTGTYTAEQVCRL
jgi:hypothetical protein